MDLKWLCIIGIVSAIYTLCIVSAVDVFVTCDELCDIYVDDVVVDMAISDTRRVRLPQSARLVAIKATQSGDPTTGYIKMWPDYDVDNPQPYLSDATWKCSHVEKNRWTDPRFDETDWAHAALVTSYSGSRGERLVWSSTRGWTAYCRFWLPNEAKCAASSPSAKIECANNVIHQGECEHRGCCYEDTGVQGVPRCYYVLNALPAEASEPIISDKVPRTYLSFGLEIQSAPMAAQETDNALVGAYRQGTPTTCFRACLLTSCKSMHYHAQDGSCVLYRQELPLRMADQSWSFYGSVTP